MTSPTADPAARPAAGPTEPFGALAAAERV